MTALSFNDRQMELVRRISGDGRLLVPSEGEWREASPEEYEDQARNLASGLMVRGVRRGGRVSLVNSSAEITPFVLFGCKLAHLELTEGPCDDSQSVVIDASSDDILYLTRIGASWINKYRYLIDRSFRELENQLSAGDRI